MNHEGGIRESAWGTSYIVHRMFAISDACAILLSMLIGILILGIMGQDVDSDQPPVVGPLPVS